MDKGDAHTALLWGMAEPPVVHRARQMRNLCRDASKLFPGVQAVQGAGARAEAAKPLLLLSRMMNQVLRTSTLSQKETHMGSRVPVPEACPFSGMRWGCARAREYVLSRESMGNALTTEAGGLQAVGDALSGVLLVEAGLRVLGWTMSDWAGTYTDLPSRQLKVRH